MSEEIEKYKFCFNDDGLCVSPIDYKTLKMTAKEMFEKLGYEYQYNPILKSLEFIRGAELIVFYTDDKSFYKQYGYETGDITLGELKAINKQIEELGWDNE